MERLRIGIDGYNLAMRHGTGIATYGYTLAHVLKAAGHRIEGVFGIDVGGEPDLREVLFFDRLAGEPPPPTRRQARADLRRLRRRAALAFAMRADEVPLTGRVETAELAARLPAFDRLATAPRLFEVAHRHFALYGRFVRLRLADPPDIMHWTYPVPVELAGARNVYAIHDIVPLRLPYTTLDAKAAYRRLLARCIATAAHVCTVSEASRADILAEFGADPARVTNTWQAAPPRPEAPADAADDAAMVESVYGLKRRGYFLFFGAIEPKKNVARLVEAYLSLRTATPLVLVGGRSWQAEEALSLLAHVEATQAATGTGDGPRVVRLDYLPRTMLDRLVRSARALVFPSLYEGFGLPVLEAMRLGTPVLTARTSSLPEVAGDAAVYVDPYSIAAIAEGLRALDDDPALRERLGKAGEARAAFFADDRYLARLHDMYARVMATAA